MFNRVVAAGCVSIAAVVSGSAYLLQSATQSQPSAAFIAQEQLVISVPAEIVLDNPVESARAPELAAAEAVAPSEPGVVASGVALAAPVIVEAEQSPAVLSPPVPAEIAQADATPSVPADVAPSKPAAKNDMRPARKPQVTALQLTNTVLAPVAHTTFCLRYPEECRETFDQVGDVVLTAARRAELNDVNVSVNRSITATAAFGETAATEKWLIAPANGDCNDFAVTKRHLLLAKGWPSRALLLAEVIVDSGEHHVVLVVRTSQGDLVLDNLNDQMRSANRTGYEWVRMQTPENPKYWASVRVPGPIVVAVRSGINQRTIR